MIRTFLLSGTLAALASTLPACGDYRPASQPPSRISGSDGVSARSLDRSFDDERTDALDAQRTAPPAGQVDTASGRSGGAGDAAPMARFTNVGLGDDHPAPRAESDGTRVPVTSGTSAGTDASAQDANDRQMRKDQHDQQVRNRHRERVERLGQGPNDIERPNAPTSNGGMSGSATGGGLGSNQSRYGLVPGQLSTSGTAQPDGGLRGANGGVLSGTVDGGTGGGNAAGGTTNATVTGGNGRDSSGGFTSTPGSGTGLDGTVTGGVGRDSSGGFTTTPGSGTTTGNGSEQTGGVSITPGTGTSTGTGIGTGTSTTGGFNTTPGSGTSTGSGSETTGGVNTTPGSGTSTGTGGGTSSGSSMGGSSGGSSGGGGASGGGAGGG